MCVNGSLFWGRGSKTNSGFVIISQRDLPKKLSSIAYQLRTIPLRKKTGKNFPPFSHSHFKFIWLKKKSKGNLRSLFNVQKKAISLEIVSFLSFQLKMVSNISATANSTWQTCVLCTMFFASSFSLILILK